MRPLLLTLLISCAPSEDEFAGELVEISCDRIFECTAQEDIDAMGILWIFGDDAEECYELFEDDSGTDTATAEDDCEYDKKAAKECLKEFDALSCDDGLDAWPDICDDVCG